MTRKLKVEPHGEMFCGATGSKLRLKGKWLAELGFLPGQHIELTVVSPGVLQLAARQNVVVALPS